MTKLIALCLCFFLVHPGFAAVRLDGTDDFVDIPGPGFIPPGAMTVEVLFRPDNYGSGNFTTPRVVSKNGGVGNRGWELVIESDTELWFYASGDGSSTADLNSSVAVAKGVWQHWVAIFRPSAAMELYRNGILVNSLTTGIPANLNNSSQNGRIGARGDQAGCPTCFFKGDVELVNIWDAALKPSDPKALYDSRVNGYSLSISTGLRVSYMMNAAPNGEAATSANSIQDRSGNNYHGSPSGSPVGIPSSVFSYP